MVCVNTVQHPRQVSLFYCVCMLVIKAIPPRRPSSGPPPPHRSQHHLLLLGGSWSTCPTFMGGGQPADG